MAEGKARNRVESSDSARERNAGVRPQGPAACLRAPHRQVARMDFFNGLLGRRFIPSRYVACAELVEGCEPGDSTAEFKLSISGTDH